MCICAPEWWCLVYPIKSVNDNASHANSANAIPPLQFANVLKYAKHAWPPAIFVTLKIYVLHYNILYIYIQYTYCIVYIQYMLYMLYCMYICICDMQFSFSLLLKLQPRMHIRKGATLAPATIVHLFVPGCRLFWFGNETIFKFRFRVDGWPVSLFSYYCINFVLFFFTFI